MAPFIVALAVFLLPCARALAVWARSWSASRSIVARSARPAGRGSWSASWRWSAAVGRRRAPLDTWGARHRQTPPSWRWWPSASGSRATCTTSSATRLTVVTVKAELAERLVDVDPERASRELAQIRDADPAGAGRDPGHGRRAAGGAPGRPSSASARPALAAAGIDGTVRRVGEVVDPRHRLVLAWVAARGGDQRRTPQRRQPLRGQPRPSRTGRGRRRSRTRPSTPRATACAASASGSRRPAAP